MSREIQGEYSKLTDERDRAVRQAAEQAQTIETAKAVIARNEEVIQKLEELKGVKVSEITFYSPTGNRTYSGTVPKPGRTVAVDPNVIPLGSEVYIEGIGWRTAEDTGGSIDGTDVDVFVEDRETATRGGRITRYILWR